MTTLYEAARAAGISFDREHEPRQREFHTGELALRYLDWGSDRAPLLLLLHGFAQTAHSWDFVSLSLAGSYHVIALDARGHGDSDWAQDKDYSSSAHQRDLDRLVSSLGVRSLGVIGLSMGGKTAYTFAARHADLVKALVIVDTGPVGMPSGGRRIRSFVQLPDERDSYEDFVQGVHEYQPLRSIEQIRNTLKFNVRQIPSGKWTWKYDRFLRDPGYRRPTTPPEEGWQYLRQIRCPTLLVKGDQSDVLAHETALEMMRTIRTCTYAVVERAGHIVPGDNPAGFLAAVGPWLATSYPA